MVCPSRSLSILSQDSNTLYANCLMQSYSETRFLHQRSPPELQSAIQTSAVMADIGEFMWRESTASHTQAHAWACTHISMFAHTQIHTHMPIYTRMYSTPYIMLTQHTRAHTHAHTSTYTLTHKCTHRCLHPHFACIYLVKEKSTLYWDTKRQSLIFKKPRVTNNKENI